MKLNKKIWIGVFLTILFSLGVNLINIINSIFIDEVYPNKDIHKLFIYSAFFLLILIFTVLVGFFSKKVMYHIKLNELAKAKNEMIHKIFKINYKNYFDLSFASFNSYYIFDLENLMDLKYELFLNMVTDLFGVLVSFFFIMYYNFIIGFILLGILLIMLLYFLWAVRFLNSKYKEVMKVEDKDRGLIKDMYQSYDEFITNPDSKIMNLEVQNITKNLYQSKKKYRYIQYNILEMNSLMNGFLIILCYVFCGYLYIYLKKLVWVF